MPVLNFLLITVIAGLLNGTQVTIQNPQFSRFIETRNGRTVLLYQKDQLHGEMLTDSISRIDFGYKKGKPFPLTVTLKNGLKMDVQSERENFLQIRGTGDAGDVMVRHPDPIAVPLKLRTRSPNRKNDLTTEFLEFK